MSASKKPALAVGAFVRLKGANLHARVTAHVKDAAGGFVEYEVAGRYANGREFACKVEEGGLELDRAAEREAREAEERVQAEERAKAEARAAAEAREREALEAAQAEAKAKARAAWDADAQLKKRFPKFEDYLAELAKEAANG